MARRHVALFALSPTASPSGLVHAAGAWCYGARALLGGVARHWFSVSWPVPAEPRTAREPDRVPSTRESDHAMATYYDAPRKNDDEP